MINTRFLVEARDGQPVAERAVQNADELGEVLKENFGISPPAPLGELFARIAG
jgi:hypothetical protein